MYCHYMCMYIFFSFQHEEFTDLAEKLPETLDKYPAVLSYIRNNWMENAHMWANFGRRFYHEDHETNNLVERWGIKKTAQMVNDMQYIPKWYVISAPDI